MQTSNAAAITAVNASLTAQSAANAEEAHTERCKAELLTYNPKTANTEQMQSYAQCVNRLHPTADVTQEIKFCIITVLICVIVGVVYRSTTGYYGVEDVIEGGFLGLLFGVGLLLVIGAVLFIIYA